MIRDDPSSLKGKQKADYKMNHAWKLLYADYLSKLVCSSSSTSHRLDMKAVVLMLCAVVAMSSATYLNYGYGGLYNPLLYKFGGLRAGLGFGYGAGLLGSLYGLGYGLGGYGLGYGLYGGYPYYKGYY